MYKADEKWSFTDMDLARLYTGQGWCKIVKKVRNASQKSNHRAQVYGVPGILLPVDVLRIYNSGLWCCVYCGRRCQCSPGEPNNMTLDHVVPLSRGGTNDRWNIVPACPECNQAKDSQELSTWLRLVGVPLTEYRYRWQRIVQSVRKFELRSGEHEIQPA
jgi:hypothetical protein